MENARELFESYRRELFQDPSGRWLKLPLGEVCENLDRIRVPITKSKRVAGDIPYYGASGIVDHVADYLFDEDLLLVSEDGANLLARTYPIAFSISGKTWVNNHAHVLRFADTNQQGFVEQYLNSISLEPWVSGMAQPKVNQKALNSIPVPWPDDEDDFASTLDRLGGIQKSVQSLTHTNQRKSDSLIELKQSILQKAFSGELTASAEPMLHEAYL